MLALIDNNGRPLSNEAPRPQTTPSVEVELSLDQLAAMAARKQSTKSGETK